MHKRYLMIKPDDYIWEDGTDEMRMQLDVGQKIVQHTIRNHGYCTLLDAVKQLHAPAKTLDHVYICEDASELQFKLIMTEKIDGKNYYVVEILGFDRFVFDRTFED